MARAGDGKPRSSKRRSNCVLRKRVTEAQRQEFAERAIRAGYGTAQEYLSAFITGDVGADVRQDMRLSLGHLGKIGSNVNQIAHSLNAGESVSAKLILAEINQTNAALERLASEIRAALKGGRQ